MTSVVKGIFNVCFKEIKVGEIHTSYSIMHEVFLFLFFRLFLYFDSLIILLLISCQTGIEFLFINKSGFINNF